MANKFFDFFNSLINNGQNSGDNQGLDPKAIIALKTQFREFNKMIDENNDKLVQLNKKMTELSDNFKNSSEEGDEYIKLLKERNKLGKEHSELQKKATEIENKYQGFLKDVADDLGVNINDVSSKIQNLSVRSKEGTSNYSAYHKAMGDSIRSVIEHTKNMKHFATATEEIGVAVVMAIEQFLTLNDRLIKFQRASGGALQARGLGFDAYGNNMTGNIGSLRSIAENNNLSIEQFLNTFSAFSKEGQIFGLTENLQKSQVALQQYGVSVGRISKLYGVSNDTLSSLAKNLSQNYGVKIKDLSNLFEDGANKALQAGINVGKFFDNMNAVSEQIGNLFLRGGTKGIEDAAFALTKLGLSANSLTKINDSLKNFGDVISKQNSSTALGLNNFAAVQARIFAKLQTGDTTGALLLQQRALGQDILSRGLRDRSGNITTQGIASLQGAGIGQDEIKSIQRLIRGAEFAGVSLEKYTNETKLSTIQLTKKRQFEEQNATFLEKLQVLYSQLKSVFIDPIASVLAPIADMLINGISVAFKLLNVVMRPAILGFQILGNALTKLSNGFSFVTKSIEMFLDKVGLGGGKGADTMTKVVDVLGNVLAVLLGISGVLIAWRTASLIRSGISTVGDFLGSIGGGKLGGILGTLGKGSAIGAGIGAAGNLIGGMVGGKAGGTISTAGSLAGLGATIGTFFGPVGTAIGAGLGALAGVIVSNWGPIKKWLTKIWESVTKFLDPIWQVVKYVTPLWWIWEGIKKIGEWLGVIDKDTKKDQEDQIKIANVVSNVPDANHIAAIMKTRTIDNTEVMKAQEKQMTNVVKAANAGMSVKVYSDLFGGYKVKAAGL